MPSIMNPGTGAAIISNQGAVCACTPNFQVQPAEAQKLAAALASPDNVNAQLSQGFNLAGKKFKFLRFDGEANVCGKLDKESVSIYKCGTITLINYADEKIQANAANEANYKMYDYFTKAGY